MPKVNPKILEWARTTAGLSLEQAAEKLGIEASKNHPAPERLAALEQGDALPSRPQLIRMAKQYRRPLLTFYLSEPPKKGDRGHDFRTLPADYPANEVVLVDVLLREMTARQQMVRATMEQEDEAVRLPFIGSRNPNDGTEQLAKTIRKELDLDIQRFYAADSPEHAFAGLRDTIEAKGVFVLLAGDLGSYHTAFSVEAFRGFAIADEIAPYIVINDRDAKSAWSFTLIHEFTHLLLGQTGISGVRAEKAIERLCNDVASEVLLPTSELKILELPENAAMEKLAEAIHAFARRRNLSSSMVAYRLNRVERISSKTWGEVAAYFRDQWLKSQARMKEQAREGGPNYYVVRRHRLGRALITLVDRMVRGGGLSTTKAAVILGVRPQNVHGVTANQANA